MSIETEIKELRGAVTALAAAIASQNALIESGINAASAKSEKPKADKPKASKPKAAEKPEPEEEKDEDLLDEDVHSTVEYSQVEKAIQTLAKTAVPDGRKRAIAILKDYDAKKGPEVDESHYANILEDLNTAIEELTDDE